MYRRLFKTIRIIKWKECVNNQLRLHLRYCPGSYLEQLRDATEKKKIEIQLISDFQKGTTSIP